MSAFTLAAESDLDLETFDRLVNDELPVYASPGSGRSSGMPVLRGAGFSSCLPYPYRVDARSAGKTAN